MSRSNQESRQECAFGGRRRAVDGGQSRQGVIGGVVSEVVTGGHTMGPASS